MANNMQSVLVAVLVFLAALAGQGFGDTKFSKTMIIDWGSKHSSFLRGGDEVQLGLDNTTGSGVRSKGGYLFGSLEMLIKLVPGDSAGTVTAYFLSSNGDKHDEIDFEFLGNRSGKPYIIHTNIFAQGVGAKEQRFYPWFDPSADYHNYTIHWNPSAVVWFVDGTPIRVFRNYEKEGVPFPNKKGMSVYSSLWNADSWATRGGKEKINWSGATFRAGLRRFRARACKWNGVSSIKKCSSNSRGNWWTSPLYNKLSSDQMVRLKWVRDNYMIYDHCLDTKRYNGTMPLVCSKLQF